MFIVWHKKSTLTSIFKLLELRIKAKLRDLAIELLIHTLGALCDLYEVIINFSLKHCLRVP